MSKEQNQQYSADSIQALEGMEHVRKRPSMYIGDVGVRGHHLVYEVVDNSIDEAMAGIVLKYQLLLRRRFISVEDDGRGIVGIHQKEGVSALEVVMTKLVQEVNLIKTRTRYQVDYMELEFQL